jgi:hypothetical protein
VARESPLFTCPFIDNRTVGRFYLGWGIGIAPGKSFQFGELAGICVLEDTGAPACYVKPYRMLSDLPPDTVGLVQALTDQVVSRRQLFVLTPQCEVLLHGEDLDLLQTRVVVESDNGVAAFDRDSTESLTHIRCCWVLLDGSLYPTRSAALPLFSSTLL